MRMVELFREQPNLKNEMAFAVDEQKYLKLAEFFIEARGHYQGRKSFGAYGQDHKPVFQQESIEGHAVRATLMATGVAAIAAANQRPEYCQTALRLWENMAGRKLYITGGVGATSEGEAFGPDYVLPNDGYLETCAAIGGGFFSRNMNLAFGQARFVDEMELVLYNAALGHVSQAGNAYSYVNPLLFHQRAFALELARLSLLSAHVHENHGRTAGLHLCAGRKRRVCEPLYRQPRHGDGRRAEGGDSSDDEVSVGGRGDDCRPA